MEQLLDNFIHRKMTGVPGSRVPGDLSVWAAYNFDEPGFLSVFSQKHEGQEYHKVLASKNNTESERSKLQAKCPGEIQLRCRVTVERMRKTKRAVKEALRTYRATDRKSCWFKCDYLKVKEAVESVTGYKQSTE